MFFFVLTSLARCSISIGLFDRPLVAAFLFGIITNTLEFSLALGIFFELFWLDALRLGAIIPPSGNLSFLLLYPLILIFGWLEPSQFVLPLLLCLSLAYTIKKVELYQRKQNNIYIEQVKQWTKNPQTGLHPSHIIYKSLWQSIWIYALLYIVLFCLLYFLFSILGTTIPLPIVTQFNWTLLYATALMGALLALRTKKAYAILLLAIIIIFFIC